MAQDVHIRFLIETDKVVQSYGGSSIKEPGALGTGHPQIIFKVGNGKWAGPYDGGYPVPVEQQAQVFLSVEALPYETEWGMAPVGIAAYKMNGVDLTVADMKDDSKKPIDRPNFNRDYINQMVYTYKGSATQWTKTTFPPSSGSQPGITVKRDANEKPEEVYGPYLSFMTQQHTGIFYYGVILVCKPDPRHEDLYYVWDPNIKIY